MGKSRTFKYLITLFMLILIGMMLLGMQYYNADAHTRAQYYEADLNNDGKIDLIPYMMPFDKVRVLINSNNTYKTIKADKVIVPIGKDWIGSYTGVFVLKRKGERRLVLWGGINRSTGTKGYDAGTIMTIYKINEKMELLKSYSYDMRQNLEGDMAKIFGPDFMPVTFLRCDEQELLFNCFNRIFFLDFNGNIELKSANLDRQTVYDVMFYKNGILQAKIDDRSMFRNDLIAGNIQESMKKIFYVDVHYMERQMPRLNWYPFIK
jgi:hypothetical protein